MMRGWFGVVASESESGLYGRNIDVSFRWGMGWFIFSEVMFFASFFGALFYARVFTMPALGDFDHKLLWPDFTAAWPHAGPAGTIDPFATFGPFWLPTINTALLVTSGFTLTVAHHALRANHRQKAINWLFAKLLLGFTFVGVQSYEYIHAYADLNLKLSSGIFGSTFFMLTGFHGFHVLVGAIMLTVVTIRLLKGHFKPDQHFAFEAAAWYWHGYGRPEAVYVIVQQNIPPWSVVSYLVPVAILQSSYEEARQIAVRYRIAERSGEFPGPYSGIQTFERPAWVAGNGEIDVSTGTEEGGLMA
jgi:cytochrome c oxidase subunit 3